MAEFKDVIRQQKRMCEANDKCAKCPLGSMDHDCRFAAMIDGDYDQAEAEVIERIVMDWAAKNPELRYPTWNEWHEANFPKSAGGPCPCNFMERSRVEQVHGVQCRNTVCSECKRTLIPADIAEKLGIKPVGGEENGKKDP